MGTFLRYLASLMFHIAWHRAGNRGGIPPVRLPRRGTVNLPALGPWQVMIAMWMIKKIWEHYGENVKTNLHQHGNTLISRAGSYIAARNARKAASADAASHGAAQPG